MQGKVLDDYWIGWLHDEGVLQLREDEGELGKFNKEVDRNHGDKAFMKANVDKVLREFRNSHNSSRTRMLLARCYVTYLAVVLCASYKSFLYL